MVIRLLNPVQPGLCLEGLLAAPCVWLSWWGEGILGASLAGTPENSRTFPAWGPSSLTGRHWEAESFLPWKREDKRQQRRWDAKREGKRQKFSVERKIRQQKSEKEKRQWGPSKMKKKRRVTSLLILCSHFYTHRIPVNEPGAPRHPCLNALGLLQWIKKLRVSVKRKIKGKRKQENPKALESS